MKKLFRFILKAFFWLLILLIVALVAVYYYLDTIVKEGINRYVPPITGTTASVEDVDLSLLKGRVEIKNLQIGNPKGYSTNDIFRLGNVQVLFDPKTVLDDKIIIKSVVISGTQVSAEMKNLHSFDNNVSALQANIDSYLGTSNKKTTATPAKQPVQKQSGGKKVIVKDLKVNDTSLSLGVSGQTITIPLPDIHKTGIGEDKKEKSIPEIIADILDIISIESVKGVGTAITDLGKQGWKGAKDLVKGGANAVTDTAKSVSDSAKNTVNGIKGLFK